MTPSHQRRAFRLAVTIASITAAACATVAVVPAANAAPAAGWRGYVVAPKSDDVRPATATVLAGDVRDPNALASSRDSSTTLTVKAGSAPATVLLDYGREVVGTPYLTVRSYSDTGPISAVHLTFSESRKYLFSPGHSLLVSDAPASARSITVAAASTFANGDTIVIGDTTNKIKAVDGTNVALTHPLGVAETAGTTVTSTPGALTGDGVGVAGYPRAQTISVTAPSQLSGTFEGGFRFETITLSQPGTVVLRDAGTHFQAYRAGAAQYQGHFLSSSDALNKMWFDGAYTEQTDMAPAGIQGATKPSVLDGAKRDRKIWSGDMVVENAGILASLGTNGADYVKQSLQSLLNLSTPGSGLAGYANPAGGSDGHDPAYSNTYSHWTLDDVTQYFRATGDSDFARQALPYLEGQLSYDATLTDQSGLLVTANVFGGANSGLDWDINDGPKAGVVASANMVYYRALTDIAYVETQLGNSGKADSYLATAAKLRDAINSNLFNPSTGAYDFSESNRGVIAQDANSYALLFGVAPESEYAGIIAALKSLWGVHGSAPFSDNAAKGPAVSPFVTGFEVEALYQIGDPTDAEKLLHLTWNRMVNPKSPFYTGTFWENYLPDGTIPDGSISASHGWSSGPTPTLTSYVLGVQPVDPGYRTFTVSPHFGSVSWANGAVPTPYGQITVSWKQSGGRVSITLYAPPGTTATIRLAGRDTVTIHGGRLGTRLNTTLTV